LVISQNLDKQVSGLKVATQNAQDGISVVQRQKCTDPGQLDAPTHPRPDRPVRQHRVVRQHRPFLAAQNEIVQLRDEIDRIGNTTAFGNQNLLDGSSTSVRKRAS